MEEHLLDQRLLRVVWNDIVKIPETTRAKNDRGNLKPSFPKGSLIYRKGVHLV